MRKRIVVLVVLILLSLAAPVAAQSAGGTIPPLPDAVWCDPCIVSDPPSAFGLVVWLPLVAKSGVVAVEEQEGEVTQAR
jgi:hypothetical protein